MTQGEWTDHIIGTTDIRLLLEFVDSLSSKSLAELWFPICLPQFDSTCFFHTYVQTIDLDMNVTVILVSPFSEVKQFDLFKNAASELKQRLGFLPTPKIAADPEGKQIGAYQCIEEASFLLFCVISFPLATALANNPGESLRNKYTQLESIFHFTFRFDSQWNGSDRCFIQHITSEAIESEWLTLNLIWTMYRQLCLQLRLGSASTDSFLLAIHDRLRLRKDCAILSFNSCHDLFESPPHKSGEVFIVNPDGTLFVGISGKNFEFYATFIDGVVPSAGLPVCRQVARILKKSQELFLNSPKRFQAKIQ